MESKILFDRNEAPFGIAWESWAAIWCSWLLSIPRKQNPSVDNTGTYCSMNQNNHQVWFLSGTFGNITPVIRKCTIPSGKAIFFPILVKEDSFVEDSDLHTESQLIERANKATDKVIILEAIVDGKNLENLKRYRVQSEVFDLKYPKDNIYGVRPGLTRSVCDGFWLFLRPLSSGNHYIHFKGETLLSDAHTLSQLKSCDVYRAIRKNVDKKSSFRLDVTYEITIM